MKNTSPLKKKHSMVYKVRDCRKYDGAFYDRIYAHLTLEEKKKIDKKRSLNERYLSLLALSMVEELTSFPIDRLRHVKGKPIVEGHYVAITHKYPYAGVIVDSDPVGIDIETIRDVDERVISYLGCKNSLSTLIEWTKKESNYKSSLKDDCRYKITIIDHKFILTICHKD